MREYRKVHSEATSQFRKIKDLVGKQSILTNLMMYEQMKQMKKMQKYMSFVDSRTS